MRATEKEKRGSRRRKRRVERFPARGGCAWWRVEVISAEEEKKNGGGSAATVRTEEGLGPDGRGKWKEKGLGAAVWKRQVRYSI